MKKIIILSVFVITTFVASAQKGLHAGIKLLPQNVWIFNKGLSDDAQFRYVSTWRVGFGASVDYHFTDKVGVGLDFIYSPQGQKYTKCESCDEVFFWKVNYFKIPLLLHFNSSSDNVAMFVGEVGTEFGFLTKSEDDGRTNGARDLKSVNVSGVLALGVGFNITDYLVTTVKIRLAGSMYDAGDAWTSGPVWMVAGALPEIGIKYVLRTDR